MSKAVVVLFATLLVCSLADPLEDIKSIVERDECSVNGLQTIKPKIHNEITILKEVQIPLNIGPRKYGS